MRAACSRRLSSVRNPGRGSRRDRHPAIQRRFAPLFFGRSPKPGRVFKYFFLQELDDRKNEYGKAIHNLIFDIKGARGVKGTFEPYEKFLFTIWEGYIEIAYSYQCLNDIPYYLNSFPYNNKRLSKSRTFKYHYENYLSEIYILRERLLKYITIIPRLYKKDKRYRVIITSLKPLFIRLKTIFDNFLIIRGRHIHVKRYSNDDFTRLEGLELYISDVTQDRVTELLKKYYLMKFKETQQKWKKSILENNKILKELFNEYFKLINQILFDSSDKINYPASIKINDKVKKN